MTDGTDEQYLYVAYNEFNDELMISDESFILKEFSEKRSELFYSQTRS